MKNNDNNGKGKMLKCILFFSVFYMLVGHTNYMGKVFDKNTTSNTASSFEFQY